MLHINACTYEPIIRNADGKIIKPAPFQSSVKSGQVARVEPNQKWFGK